MKRFFRRVRRVIDFLPIIWKGEDYDYYYSIQLFQYQLERTADFLESDKAFTSDAIETASRVRTAVELLDRVYNDHYLIQADWDDNNVEGETEAEKISRLGARPTSYSS